MTMYCILLLQCDLVHPNVVVSSSSVVNLAILSILLQFPGALVLGHRYPAVPRPVPSFLQFSRNSPARSECGGYIASLWGWPNMAAGGRSCLWVACVAQQRMFWSLGGLQRRMCLRLDGSVVSYNALVHNSLTMKAIGYRV